MNNIKCPITGDVKAKLIFSYNAPPLNEISLKTVKIQKYKREVWQFLPSGHFVSIHSMNLDDLMN